MFIANTHIRAESIAEEKTDHDAFAVQGGRCWGAVGALNGAKLTRIGMEELSALQVVTTQRQSGGARRSVAPEGSTLLRLNG